MNKKMVLSLLAGWLLLIFFFSSQTYEEQSLTSSLDPYVNALQLDRLLDGISFTYAGSEVNIHTHGTAGFIEFFIRKGAHLSIFFVLGFLTCRALMYFVKNRLIHMGAAFGFVLLYAAADEFHQKITGGRTPLLADVMIDTIGGTLGILVCVYIMRRRRNRKAPAEISK